MATQLWIYGKVSVGQRVQSRFGGKYSVSHSRRKKGTGLLSLHKLHRQRIQAGMLSEASNGWKAQLFYISRFYQKK